MKFIVLAILPALAIGNHLDGPVQDRLDKCQTQNCPGAYEYFEKMTAGDELDVKRWLTEEDYVNTEVPKMYPDVAKHLECVCRECSELTEPIFQPVGDKICAQYGVEFPCKAESEACIAAGYDAETCNPDYSIMAYKFAYDLSSVTECHSLCRNSDGENAPPCNKEDPLYKLQVCKAKSRTEAGDKSIKVVIPCDKASTEKGTCEGIPATECKFCYTADTNEPCEPEMDSRRRRLLFGGTASNACQCH